MKNKYTLKAILVALVVFVAGVASADYKTTDVSKLPQEAVKCLQQNIPAATVRLIKVDTSFLGFGASSYDTYLSDGTEIDFDKYGQWTEIENEVAGVPQAFIVDTVKEYLAKNFPNTKIVSLKKKPYGYQIELANDIEIRFDSTWKFISVDRD